MDLSILATIAFTLIPTAFIVVLALVASRAAKAGERDKA
jgi:hypothetical protein